MHSVVLELLGLRQITEKALSFHLQIQMLLEDRFSFFIVAQMHETVPKFSFWLLRASILLQNLSFIGP